MPIFDQYEVDHQHKVMRLVHPYAAMKTRADAVVRVGSKEWDKLVRLGYRIENPLRPANRRAVSYYALAADYKARGMSKQRAWDQLIIDRGLIPGIDAKEFYGIYAAADTKLLPDEVIDDPKPVPEADPEFADYGKQVRVTVRVGRHEEVREGSISRTLVGSDGAPLYEVLFDGDDSPMRVRRQDTLEFLNPAGRAHGQDRRSNLRQWAGLLMPGAGIGDELLTAVGVLNPEPPYQAWEGVPDFPMVYDLLKMAYNRGYLDAAQLTETRPIAEAIARLDGKSSVDNLRYVAEAIQYKGLGGLKHTAAGREWDGKRWVVARDPVPGRNLYGLQGSIAKRARAILEEMGSHHNPAAGVANPEGGNEWMLMVDKLGRLLWPKGKTEGLDQSPLQTRRVKLTPRLLSSVRDSSDPDAGDMFYELGKMQRTTEAVIGYDYYIYSSPFSQDEVIVQRVDSNQPHSNPYLGFRRLSGQLAQRGATDPAALAAWIGRRKYGAESFARMGAAGHTRRRSNPWTETMYAKARSIEQGQGTSSLGIHYPLPNVKKLVDAYDEADRLDKSTDVEWAAFEYKGRYGVIPQDWYSLAYHLAKAGTTVAQVAKVADDPAKVARAKGGMRAAVRAFIAVVGARPGTEGRY